MNNEEAPEDVPGGGSQLRMSGVLIRRTVVFTLLGVVGLLILLAVFFVGSIVTNWVYYSIEPRLMIPALPVPGPSGSPFLGLEGLVEILFYVLYIVAALATIVAAIVIVRRFGGGAAPQPVSDRDQLEPGTH